MKVSKPMSLKDALPLLEKVKNAGGPRAVVDAYLAETIMRFKYYYQELRTKWKEAKAYFEF